MKILIAGASGFIGTRLIKVLADDPRVTEVHGFSRTDRSAGGNEKIKWIRCDLADLDRLSEVAPRVDFAVYLVHSMSPQAKLSQGHFEDFDLQQADNFARMCEKRSIGKVFYLGGILPHGSQKGIELSAHLRSRAEVERVLGSRGAEVTVFRAGLILGAGGSSSEMLLRLVRRLPAMLVPKWTSTLSEPVDVRSVVEAIHQTFFRSEFHGKSWDLAGKEVISYRDLMLTTSQALNLKRKIIPLPAIPPEVSRLWVSLISGAPRSLVYPLVKSLAHDMQSRPDHRLLPQLGLEPISIRESIQGIIREEKKNHVEPIAFHKVQGPSRVRTVRSIQRIPGLSSERLAEIGSIAERYFLWLPHFLYGILLVDKIATPQLTVIRFKLRWTSIVFLELHGGANLDKDLERFKITGGLLHTPKSGGFLEFRTIRGENCGLSIVQDFVPRLPWIVYFWTQAILHLWVMRRFRRSLSPPPF